MSRLFYLLFISLSFGNCSNAQNKEAQAINSIFDQMELEGVNTKQPLLYGYFFYDKDQQKLAKLKDDLLKSGYKLVRFEKSDARGFVLHVEKVETHSRTSLLDRNNQLSKLRENFQVEIYDGWDVGNIDPTKPLTAKEDFDKSISTKADAEIYKIANSLYDGESYDKAALAFQKCIERNYKTDTCYYKQGVSFIVLGQTQTGIEKLEEALRINPKYYKACFNIAATCYDIQEYQKSIDYYQKTATLKPEDDNVYYGIAASQFVLGKLKDAASNCNTALTLNPNNENAKALLAHIKQSIK
ncbi:MAG TPA: ribonuclease E inhibitor RraB [Chitinophagales bacterium]|nr:ribonuclease E inhibitor RraB [Chitinophagales bacterium]